MSLPPSEIPLGAMRFNSDSQKLEYWNGGAWFQIHTFSPNLDGGARVICAGGIDSPATKDVIDFATASSAGNFIDFGDLVSSATFVCAGSTSSRTRGVMGAYSNTIQFITISSTGNSVDFGDLTQERFLCMKGCVSTGHGGLG